MAGNEQNNTVLTLPGRFTPVLILAPIVSCCVIGFVGLLAVVNKLPLFLIVPLAVAVLSAGILVLESLKQFLPQAITIRHDGLSVARGPFSQTYAWRDIQEIKLIAGTGTLGDDPLAKTAERLGLGLFLRQETAPKRTARNGAKTKGSGSGAAHASASKDPETADVIIGVGSVAQASAMVAICERLTSARKAASGAKTRRGYGRPPATGKRGEFRKSAVA